MNVGRRISIPLDCTTPIFSLRRGPAGRGLSSISSARVCLALLLGLGLGACSDAPTATIETPTRASASVAVTTPSQAQAVARDLGLAMSDPAIRRRVHQAMRVSRFNEHKLVLQDVVNTPNGENLFSAEDKRAIANLPALDFYLPFTSQRQSWKPTADVYVAVTFDLNAAAVTAYGTNGQTMTVQRVRFHPFLSSSCIPLSPS